MRSTAIAAIHTLREFAVNQDLVRLAGCELLDGIQWPPVQAMDARALLRQQQIWEVAVEEHLHMDAQAALRLVCQGVPAESVASFSK